MSSPKTVFNMASLRVLQNGDGASNLSRTMSYYTKNNLFDSPRAGIYVKKGYDTKEMSSAIFWPTYISLGYVLARAGVIFQYDSAITCVGKISRTIEVDGTTYVYKKINPVLWSDFKGIEQNDGYAIATPERAFLDMMYLYPGVNYFDNISALDLDRVFDLLPSYKNESLSRRVKKMFYGQV